MQELEVLLHVMEDVAEDVIALPGVAAGYSFLE